MFSRAPHAPVLEEGDVTIRTRRLPLWRGTLTLTATLTLVLIASTAADVLPRLFNHERLDAEATLSCLLIAVWLSICAIDFVRRACIRRWPIPNMVFQKDTLWLPKHAEALRPRQLRYDALMAVGESGRVSLAMAQKGKGRTRLLRQFFLETDRKVFTVPEQIFADPSGAEMFFAELQRRLSALPQGAKRLTETERARKPAAAAMRLYPYATQICLGIIAVFFLNTWLKGALDTPFGLLRWGAMAPALVRQSNEMYRLLAANFLHGHWLHVIMNVLALSYLGALLERLLGRARVTIVYLAAAACGMLASAFAAQALLSVGASGAIFGLLGAFAFVSHRLRTALPLGIRQPPRWWVSLLTINIILPLVWPVIDWAAHVAGFIAGALVAFALLGRRRTLPPQAGRLVTGIAAALTVLYVLALGQAVWRAADTTATQETRLAKMLLRDARTPAAALNNLAWLWAIDPGSDAEHIEAGQNCAAEAIRRAPQVPEFRVTQASLARRKGDWAAAMASWREALEIALRAPENSSEEVQAVYAMQLVRSWDNLPPALRPQAPLVQRSGNLWQLRGFGTLKDAQVTYLAVRGPQRRLAAVVRLVLPAGLQAPWPLPEAVAQALRDVGAQDADAMLLQSLTPVNQLMLQDGPWHLWRPPALLENEGT